MMDESLASYLDEVRSRVDHELALILGERPDDGHDPGRLREAMRYAVLGAGKRLRPAVTLAACNTVGGSLERALPAACAIELLHAYTLVHDDLPAMDNDAIRRGKPTVHVAFGEASAILAGDALLTLAFGTLARLGATAVTAIEVLAERTGARELLAGQARDLEPCRIADLSGLEALHAQKTGALFAAAAELGGIAGAGDLAVRRRLAEYGMLLGLAFQHADDLADGDHSELAKEARNRQVELAIKAQDMARALGSGAIQLTRLADWVARLSSE